MVDKRAQLESAALETVQTQGFKSLSFRTLADDVGIKSSSVHYYFPEKGDLARVLIERYSESFAAELQNISEKPWKLRKKLTSFIKLFEDVAIKKRVCLCGMLAAEVEQLNADNRKLMAAFFVDMEAWLTSQLSQHDAELNSRLSRPLLAKSMVAGLEGALLLDRVANTNTFLKAQKDVIFSLLE